MSVEAFIGCLKRGGLEPTAASVLDAIWLASGNWNLDLGIKRPVPVPKPEPTQPATTMDAQKKPTPAKADHTTPEPAPNVDIDNAHSEPVTPPDLSSEPRSLDFSAGRAYPRFLPDPALPADIPAALVRLPAARTLPRRLRLTMALRHLRARYPSRSVVELDEEATVELTAELSLRAPSRIAPVTRRQPERWYGVDLVIEDDPIIGLWAAPLREFVRVLAQSGAFRSIHIWRLRIAPGLEGRPERLWLERPSAGRVGVRGLSGDPRRLVYFVSHGLSRHWRNGGAYPRLLAGWAGGSLAMLHLLPGARWARTRLGEPHGVCRADLPGAAAASLRVEAAWWRTDIDPRKPGVLRLPVTGLDPAPLDEWARMQMSRGGDSPVYLFDMKAAPEEAPLRPSLDEMSPREAKLRLVNLRETSPDAFRLARTLAPAPFTLPVARVVQETLLSDGDHQVLADLLISGFIIARGPAEATVDEATVFEIAGPVREALLAGGRPEDAETVAASLLARVGRHLAATASRDLDFEALLADPAGREKLPIWARPFADFGAGLHDRARRKPKPIDVKAFLVAAQAEPARLGDYARLARHGPFSPAELRLDLRAWGLDRDAFENAGDGRQRLREEITAELRDLPEFFGARMLWVDDRPKNNTAEAAEFKSLGAASIRIAMSTEDALDALDRESFDLILSDMACGREARAGFHLLAALQERECATPVIIYAAGFASKEANRRSVVQASGYGCTNSPNELRELASNALRDRLFGWRPTHAAPKESELSDAAVGEAAAATAPDERDDRAPPPLAPADPEMAEIIERLKAGGLLESDYAVLAGALTTSAAKAWGPGSVAIGSDVSNSEVTTFVLQLGDAAPITLSEAVCAKLGERLRKSLPAVLNNLPPVAAAFTGRVEEEAEIVRALIRVGRGAAAISALGGIGGIGKTALAVKIAHRLAPLFPAAQLIVDLRGASEMPTTPRAAMESVIRRFYPIEKLPNDDAAMGEIYRDLLSKNKSLLVLDNARDAAQVTPLLPPAPSAALVTSRRILPLVEVKSLRLDHLPLSAAKALIVKLLDGDRTLSDAELTQLADACLCHPLSLEIAALFLKNYLSLSVADYLASVEKDRARLKIDGQTEHGILAVVGQSVKRLEAEGAGLVESWWDLAVFPADFDATAAAAVSGRRESQRERQTLLKRLFGGLFPRKRIETEIDWPSRLSLFASRGLLEAIGEGRYRMHGLLQEVARRGSSVERHGAAAARHAQRFIDVLRTANNLYLAGGAKIGEGLALYDRERTNIEAGQRWAAERVETSSEAARSAAAYAAVGNYVLNLRLHPREWIRWCEVALAANRSLDDRTGVASALGNLGGAYYLLGEIRKAITYYDQHLAIAREIGDRGGEANALGNAGLAFADLGETRRAIEYYEKQLVITREIGDSRGLGVALGNVGLAYASLGETRKAIEYYEKQWGVTQEIGDPRGESAALGYLGVAYADLGDIRRAIGYYERALDISREIGDRRGEGQVLGNLGVAYADLGDIKRAIGYYERALDISHEIGDRRGEGQDLGNLGLAYGAIGEPRKAIEYYERQLAITREIGDRRGESAALGNIGVAYAALGEIKRAIEHHEQALVTLREVGDRRGEGAALGNLGNAYADLGETHKAIEYYERYLTIAREIGDRRGEANARANLGLALKANDPATAHAHWEQALAILTAIEDPNAARVEQWLAELGKSSGAQT